VAYLLATPVFLFLVALVVGGVTGRVQVSSCCSIADPSRDLRMRSAYGQPEGAEQSDRGST
jgi:hypothetical protein